MRGETVAGRYEIRAPPGGGRGTVHDAFDTLLGRRVALRLVRLPPPGDAAAALARARFRRGAAAAGRLSHPHIAAVLGHGEDADRAWIATEWVGGGSLRALLARGGRPSVPRAVRLTAELLAALAHAHARGVVHGGVGPAAILLDPGGGAKLTGFGIARLLDAASVARVGAPAGAPAPAVPGGRPRGGPVDQRADLWAAGVVLYRLLTGEEPFDGGVAAAAHAALHGGPIPPSLLAPAVPDAFDAVVAAALAEAPEDRHASAAAFLAALRDAAAAAVTAAAAPPRRRTLDDAAELVPGRRAPEIQAPPEPHRVPAPDADHGAPSAPRPRPPAPPPRPGRRDARPRRPWRDLAFGGAAGAAVATAAAAALLLLGGEGRQAPTEASPTPPIALQAPPPPASLHPRPTVPEPPPRAAGPVPPPPPPGPPSPAPPPPRPDLRTLASVAAASFTCGLVAAEAGPDSIALTGLARRDEAEGAGRLLDLLGVPPGVARTLRIQPFDGPFCGVLAAVRDHAAPPGAAPRVRPDGPSPPADGQPFGFRVETPDWQPRLLVAALAATGEVVHLVRGQTIYGANAAIGFAAPRWRASAAPHGTDLLLVVASERPLFGGDPRPREEGIDGFAAALASALRAAEGAGGGRVAVRVIPVAAAPR
jgi:serine/threonine-protein kinase